MTVLFVFLHRDVAYNFLTKWVLAAKMETKKISSNRSPSVYKNPTAVLVPSSLTGLLWQLRVCLFIKSSFLPPHFGLLDRPEVRVVDHAVLRGLYGGNDAAGRKHGVLFVRSWIILRGKRKHFFLRAIVAKHYHTRKSHLQHLFLLYCWVI